MRWDRSVGGTVNWSTPRKTCDPFWLKPTDRMVKSCNEISDLHHSATITKTCPYNIQRSFSAVKIENFNGKNLKFLIFLLKTLIVGTR